MGELVAVIHAARIALTMPLWVQALVLAFLALSAGAFAKARSRAKS